MSNVKNSVLTSFLLIRSNIAKYVSRFVPHADVEDIVQDTFVRLCNLKDQRAEKYNKSYLYTVARNISLDHLKRAEFNLADKVDVESDYPNIEHDSCFEDALTNEKFGDLCRIVQNMPKQCRKVFVLRKVYGFSQQEIADKLGISVNTVSNHLVNGVKFFRKSRLSNQLLDELKAKKNINLGG
jgi:RNA polymerase sigma factor (sigma-70 family)